MSDSWLPNVVAIIGMLTGAVGTFTANWQKNEIEKELAVLKFSYEKDINESKQKHEREINEHKSYYELSIKEIERQWSAHDKQCERLVQAAKDIGASFSKVYRSSDLESRYTLESNIWSAATLLNNVNRNIFMKVYQEHLSKEDEFGFQKNQKLASVLLQSLVIQANECLVKDNNYKAAHQ